LKKTLLSSPLLAVTLASAMIFSALMYSCSFAAKTMTDASKGTEVTKMVDAYVEEKISDKKVKGAAVTVVHDGHVLISKGYGFADEENNIHADSDTGFRIGSVSKTFVALAAMQLVEKGRLQMYAPISQYLGNNSPSLQYPVTMRQLLTHTAGFEEISSGLFFRPNESLLPLYDTLIKYTPKQVYQPGEVFAYSNYGITLAGYVIQNITGKDFVEYANQSIFKLLSMNNSTYNVLRPKAPIVSKGYNNDGTEREESLVQFYPCGSITSTADDMGKYMNFLLSFNDTPALSKVSRQELFKRQYTLDEEFDGIGYCWGRCLWNGHYIYSHEGGTQNFSTVVLLCPSERLGVFVSFNTQADMHEIISSVSSLLYGPEDISRYNKPYNGTDSQDISGYYTSTISSHTSTEKIFNLTTTIQIKGNPSTGFSFNAKKLQHVGKNAYFHPELGYFKFMKKNGHSFLVTSECFSFLRIPWYDNLGFQASMISFYTLTCLMIFIMSIIQLVNSIRKRKSLKIAMSIPGILSFGALVFTLFHTYVFIDRLEYASAAEFFIMLRNCGRMMFITGGMTTVSAIYFSLFKKNWFVCIISVIWTISFISLTLWLSNLNLLL